MRLAPFSSAAGDQSSAPVLPARLIDDQSSMLHDSFTTVDQPSVCDLPSCPVDNDNLPVHQHMATNRPCSKRTPTMSAARLLRGNWQNFN